MMVIRTDFDYTTPMKKRSTSKTSLKDLKLVKNFINDVKVLSALPVLNQYQKLFLPEYPFDNQMISLSPLYRKSRQAYLSIGGKFTPAVCSTMRSLSSQDLFKNDIHYTPIHTEMTWLQSHIRNMQDSIEQINAIKLFHDISIFHEQNHRIIWQLLPKAPTDKVNLRRYLNFAESLVVALDLALADQVQAKLSKILERMCLLYRPAGGPKLSQLSKKEYRQYLLSAFCATYYTLERIHADDILSAVNYVLPENKKLNRLAVARSLELNQDFTEVTNPQWQNLYWQSAVKKLEALHKNSKQNVFLLPEDPLDLEAEFGIAESIFDYFEV